ncbi:uncharacterized protein LOC143216227 [Lasioglossum baleicum]|uniref:uncharacterized protein LOC143216227 n=1 Tax=Lasioglossum baleicum TaxID=434251 RepID=UPI003FCE61D7
MSRYILVLAFLIAVAFASEESAANDSNSASSEETPDCPKNEAWALCGKICEPSCCTPKPEICPAIACSKLTAACRCKRNFVRNDKQQCVRLAQCKQSCPQK